MGRLHYSPFPCLVISAWPGFKQEISAMHVWSVTVFVSLFVNSNSNISSNSDDDDDDDAAAADDNNNNNNNKSL